MLKIFRALVLKYGIVPKSVTEHLETPSCKDSKKMLASLNAEVIAMGTELRNLVSEGVAVSVESYLDKVGYPREMKSLTLKVSSLVFSFLGEPLQSFECPAEFDASRPVVTPIEFYVKYIKPVYNLQDKVVLISAPDREYNALYCVHRGKNRQSSISSHANSFRACFTPPETSATWLNVTPERMKQCALDSLFHRKEAIWIGCDVSPYCMSCGY